MARSSVPRRAWPGPPALHVAPLACPSLRLELVDCCRHPSSVDDMNRQKLLHAAAAAAPLLLETNPAPPIMQPATQTALFDVVSDAHHATKSSWSFLTADVARIQALMDASQPPKTRPRPAQGGQRITKGWLYSLPPSECIWRFK